MNWATVGTVLVVIAVAELPDKTMIATLLMGARGAPMWVWLGSSAAFLVHVGIAVLAGQLISRLPHTALEVVVTCVFAGGAAWLLFVPEREEAARGAQEAAEAGTLKARPLAVASTAFGVILLGEFGDLTQLLTVGFVAHTHDPAAVALGAAVGLVTVSGFAAFSGRALARVVRTSVLRRVGGVLLAVLTAVSIAQLAGA